MPTNNTKSQSTLKFTKKHGSYFYTVTPYTFYVWAIHTEWQGFNKPDLFNVYEMVRNENGNLSHVHRHIATDLRGAKTYVIEMEKGA